MNKTNKQTAETIVTPPSISNGALCMPFALVYLFLSTTRIEKKTFVLLFPYVFCIPFVGVIFYICLVHFFLCSISVSDCRYFQRLYMWIYGFDYTPRKKKSEQKLLCICLLFVTNVLLSNWMYIHNYVYIVKAVVFSFGFECKHNNPSVKPSNTKKNINTKYGDYDYFIWIWSTECLFSIKDIYRKKIGIWSCILLMYSYSYIQGE